MEYAPKFLPLSSPRNAPGVASRPWATVSRYLRVPLATPAASSVSALGQTPGCSPTMKPWSLRRWPRMSCGYVIGIGAPS
jgi:hypothetical protein